MRINHNIPALRALHQLDKSNSKLDKTLERLSSGLRINHAADDAAGLAITQKMDTQVRGLKQANRNAMDGISLIQTAEGALNEVHSMLQRIRELAVQVSNGTYDAQDRKAVQDEVRQMQSEIDRISSSIEFNEMKLLNGDIDRRAFSTNADVADIVSMSDTVEAGAYTFTVAQTAAKTSDIGGPINLFDGNGESTVTGTININGEQVQLEAGDTTEQVFSKLRNLASRVDVSVTISPAPPFGNGKALQLEMNQFGPRTLDVTGDLTLLQALGLDNQNFQPNTSNVYRVTTDVGVAINLTGLSGSVLINGTTVSLDGATDNSDVAVYEKLKAANIPGLELSYSNAGALTVYSAKPLVVEPANPTALTDVNLSNALTPLEAGVAVTGVGTADLVKSVPDAGITTDGGAADELTGTVAVFVGGVQVGINIDWTGGLNLDDPAERATALSDLNTQDIGDTIFAFTDDVPSKLVAYNRDGLSVVIKPVSNVTAADTTTVKNLGYESGIVTQEKGFGNLGRHVQIDSASIVYDDPATVNIIDGFPAGTTVTTSGRDVVFESNNNFELRLVAGNTTGAVTMNLLRTGPLDLQIGANEGQFMEIRIQNLSPRALGITDINLSTSSGAQEAITVVDDAIQTISAVRSKLGAYQNRLEHTIANLETASENMTASLSRILDADMAYEMSQFTQQNIIQQAGTSMLAQANQRPQSLLQLLQG
jgi:flagellin-like hook-associated protein FlgL